MGLELFFRHGDLAFGFGGVLKDQLDGGTRTHLNGIEDLVETHTPRGPYFVPKRGRTNGHVVTLLHLQVMHHHDDDHIIIVN